MSARVWLGDQWFPVNGILDEFELSPDLDRAALVGMDASEGFLGSGAIPSAVYVRNTLTALFLGLGAVALLVGGVGIANVMVISVLEHRAEIGLRRALGATRGHIAVQFLGEALLLSALGGLAGVALGYGVTALWSAYRGWDVLVPTIAIVGGLGAALVIGTLAGFYPAIRASRLTPTEALRTG